MDSIDAIDVRSARSFWLEAPGCGRIRHHTIPEPGPDQVRVRTLYSGVSRGTEALIFQGRVPDDQFHRMRAPHQEGEFPAPVKYGYINVGEVEQGPAALLGQHVFCLYPHQDRYVVDASDVVPLPDAVPAARAVLAAYMETAITGNWDASPQTGERIAVVGAGVLGCLSAWLAGQTAGTDVTLIDINPSRATLAEALGLQFATPDRAPLDCDLIIHASGSADGLQQALTLAGDEARIVELSWFGDTAVSLSLGRNFHSRRLTLRSSQVGRIPPVMTPRWTHRRRLSLALSLLGDQRLDVLIDGDSRFEDLPATLQRLSTEPGAALCHRVCYAAAPRRSSLNSMS